MDHKLEYLVSVAIVAFGACWIIAAPKAGSSVSSLFIGLGALTIVVGLTSLFVELRGR